MLYLLVDTGIKQPDVIHVCKDVVKAQHWKELLELQNINCIVIKVSDEIEDVIDSMKGEK